VNAIWASVAVKVVLGLTEGICGWLRQKRDGALKQTADAQKKALESVAVSTDVENKIRKEQADVDKNSSDGKKPDGGVGDWNAGK
jgi:uncharacterized protein HemX